MNYEERLEAAATETGLYAKGMEDFARDHARNIVDAFLAGDTVYTVGCLDSASRITAVRWLKDEGVLVPLQEKVTSPVLIQCECDACQPKEAPCER